jgi:hypothetical protein
MLNWTAVFNLLYLAVLLDNYILTVSVEHKIKFISDVRYRHGTDCLLYMKHYNFASC